MSIGIIEEVIVTGGGNNLRRLVRVRYISKTFHLGKMEWAK